MLLRQIRLDAGAAGVAANNSGLIQNVSVSASISGGKKSVFGGLVARNSGGIIRNSSAAMMLTSGAANRSGGLVGINSGVIVGSSATGTVKGGYSYGCGAPVTGGLVGSNSGTISSSRVSATVDGGSSEYTHTCEFVPVYVGGLAGQNSGTIDQTFSLGDVKIGGGGAAGNLVGGNYGQVTNAYATGATNGGGDDDRIGGLHGENAAAVMSSYATGTTSGGNEGYEDFGCPTGGLVGCSFGQNNYTQDYWDEDTTGVSDPAKGCGNVANCPGVTGLTDAEMKSGLPDGFDPKIWSSNPNINNGYPYLLANPPQ
jgi:hypothetical protein